MSELPPNWHKTQLAELLLNPKANIVDGPFGSNLKASEYQKSGVPILRIQNIRRFRFIPKNIKYIKPNKANDLNRHSYMPGDIIITKLGDPLGEACILPDSITAGVIVADLVRLRLDHDFIDKKWLCYAINADKTANQLKNLTKGTTRPRVNLTHIRSLEIDVPPLNEQKRIVAKIEELFSELDSGIESLKTARAQLKIYRQAILKYAFEGKLTAEWREQNPYPKGYTEKIKVEIKRYNDQKLGQDAPRKLPPINFDGLYSVPEGWFWVEAHRVCSSVRDGTHDTPKYVGEGVPLVTSKNLKGGYIDLNDTDKISLEDHEEISWRSSVDAGDVLFGMIGTIGNPVIIEEGNVFSIKNVGLFKKNENLISSKYLAYYLSSFACEMIINQKDLIRGTNQKFISLGGLRVLPIPLPRIEEQSEINRILDKKLSAVDCVENEIDQEILKAEALQQSILKKAFSGQLVTQDPNDEPASVLLERIRAEKPQVKPEKLSRPKKKKESVRTATVISFLTTLPSITTTDLHAGIIGLAYKQHEQDRRANSLGHVKMEKIAHLVEYHLGISLGRTPVKDAAGPNDYPHLKKVEHRAKMANWFSAQQRSNSSGWFFSKKRGFDALITKTMNALGDKATKVEKLIELFIPMDMQQAELVATLYAAWNNLLITGTASPTDEKIVTEARENWHPAKLNIERELFFKELQWLKSKELIPSGIGMFINAKEKGTT